MSDLIICDEIENDEFYKEILNNDVKNNLSYSLSISEQVKKLGEGIDILSQELQKQVLAKHDDLLLQAAHATKLELVLNVMNTHVQCLFSNAERLKAQITTPFNNIETHTRVLSRLHQASHILRRVNRIQQLSKKLHSTSDPVSQATVLQELEQLALDSDLSDIEAVSSELRSARSQRQNVIRLATGSLTQGITTSNVSQTSTALQIFINLELVGEAIGNIVNAAVQESRESLRSSVEIAGLANSAVAISGRGGKATGTGRAAPNTSIVPQHSGRTRLFTAIDKTFAEEIYMNCKQIEFLQGILVSLKNCEEYKNFAIRFWNALCDAIIEELKKSSSSVQQLFETEYPKLLKCYSEMTLKLKSPHYEFKQSLFEKWENAYLSNSLTRLMDPVNTMFNMEAAPSHDQIDALIRTISNELSVSLVEDHLSEKIAKNVSKCIRLYAVKSEQLIAAGPDASQVIAGAPTSCQQLNIKIANSLHYLQTQVNRMLSNMAESLSARTVETISDSVKSLDPLTISILQPLADSMNKTIETVIVTIHLEPDWERLQLTGGPGKQISCSPYMRELMQVISRVFHTYLAPFTNQHVLTATCDDIAVRCIELFVRHSSLLRPISPGGRLRLQSDYLFLENALRVLCPQLAELGRPYRLLKSMATIITLPPVEIVSSQAVGSAVPHSIVLLLLFSHAGTELASPHQTAQWSINKLSTWLDQHPLESDRLELIAGALQRYVSIVRKKGSTNYDPMYPVITGLLENAMKK